MEHEKLEKEIIQELQKLEQSTGIKTKTNVIKVPKSPGI